MIWELPGPVLDNYLFLKPIGDVKRVGSLSLGDFSQARFGTALTTCYQVVLAKGGSHGAIRR